MMEYTAWIMRYTLNNDPKKIDDLKNAVVPKGIEDFIKKDIY